jgi:hypothetical protein
LPVYIRNGRLQQRKGGVAASAAAGGDPLSGSLADGGCERERDSQPFQHRHGLIIFEPTRPIGTKTITDKNLLSCGIANCVMDPILRASAPLPFRLRAQPSAGSFHGIAQG